MRTPTVSVAGDSLPAELQVGVTVEVVEQCSEQSPARLEIRVVNEGDETRRFEFDHIEPFTAMGDGEPGDHLVHVVPDPDDENSRADYYEQFLPERPVDGCWRLQRLYARPLTQIAARLTPNDAVSRTYLVVADPSAEDCLPSGTYRFDVDSHVREPDADESRAYSWGFDLTLEDE
ncbi:hypothetical protein [Haloarchaeobius sp. DFWS5]|uniref:hypothetical protein n=1 Tax=Haloarchaeobius sp. DFWS5 TaxID=3446114 RepID=UPI003EB93EE3